MHLTEHFTKEELTFSETAVRKGIDNTPDLDTLDNLTLLAGMLERVRAILRYPITISSAYRSPKLNTAIGGSKSSAHMKGLAADFRCPEFGTPKEICHRLRQEAARIGFEQLINEQRWVHISAPQFASEPSLQVLTAHFCNGPVTYTEGLEDE